MKRNKNEIDRKLVFAHSFCEQIHIEKNGEIKDNVTNSKLFLQNKYIINRQQRKKNTHTHTNHSKQ